MGPQQSTAAGEETLHLVSRFRSSHHCAAHSFANFGIKGTLAIYDSSAVFGFEVPTQTRGYNDRNFKSTALGRDKQDRGRRFLQHRCGGVAEEQLVARTAARS